MNLHLTHKEELGISGFHNVLVTSNDMHDVLNEIPTASCKNIIVSSCLHTLDYDNAIETLSKTISKLRSGGQFNITCLDFENLFMDYEYGKVSGEQINKIIKTASSVIRISEVKELLLNHNRFISAIVKQEHDVVFSGGRK